MSSLFSQVTKLICAVWPKALTRNDFVDPILRTTDWIELDLVETVKSM